MPPSDDLSLRERKKLETWALIHDAAAELALDEDTTCVTVEAIASEAGVSQRTFFNYFPTKEDAILGVRAPAAPELPEGFLDGGDLLRRTTELLLDVSRSGYADRDVERRGRLFAKYPNLLVRRRELSLQCEDLVQQALAEAMAVHPEWSRGLHGHGVEDTARMLTTAAGVPLRYAVMAQGPLPSGQLEPETVRDAIELFQDLYGKLS
ncbi:helix-turn-helix domain-containing protein [Citricoccus sp. SGAir0253]|uniref:helix-turn-helix domain-containing protein n=1 Tax=Citricoccus sp. SGAir0253 TaxID=2567881 RepID=UPI00143CEC9E|nr:TetR/AcrR family transcriptional regulator [Citricoccus sp. SGAir0253]